MAHSLELVPLHILFIRFCFVTTRLDFRGMSYSANMIVMMIVMIAIIIIIIIIISFISLITISCRSVE